MVAQMVTGIFMVECSFPPLVEIRGNPEFHDIMRMDKGHWPRCLPWHGWLRLLSGVNGASPWEETAAQGAGNLLDSALGSYSSWLLFDWRLPDEFDASDAATRVPDNPNILTDGRLVFWTWYLVPLYLVLGFMLISLVRLGDIVGGSTLMIVVLLVG